MTQDNTMSNIDWTAPIEAVADTGEMFDALLKPMDEDSREVFWETHGSVYVHRFYENGLPHPGNHAWRIRNKAQPKADIPEWAFQRARDIGLTVLPEYQTGSLGGVIRNFAIYLANKEEPPVDPDIAIAEVMAKQAEPDMVTPLPTARLCHLQTHILAAIKRGRELERGEVK